MGRQSRRVSKRTTMKTLLFVAAFLAATTTTTTTTTTTPTVSARKLLFWIQGPDYRLEIALILPQMADTTVTSLLPAIVLTCFNHRDQPDFTPRTLHVIFDPVML